MTFSNVYADGQRAESYARLEFPGTYYLAYRDLPAILAEHVHGKAAIDFGCGTGRSTRFLRQLGFDTVGVDISAEMIAMARRLDPDGAYALIDDGDLSGLDRHAYDLALAVFTFDNIPGEDHRVRLLGELRDRLKSDGVIVLVDSTPELYLNEWASFSTAASCPSNLTAKAGDVVYTVMLDVEDRRPVEDILWLDEDYRTAFDRARLRLIETYRPLGRRDDPHRWVNETRIAPWVIYVARSRLA
ncbi:MAG TPA: class I SAM-dependent methyltransferase [Gemmatimonadaceae bacterium]|nr:class I SAM-dependent methyltransferase [Gemmatimonadaceae bacterium]